MRGRTGLLSLAGAAMASALAAGVLAAADSSSASASPAAPAAPTAATRFSGYDYLTLPNDNVPNFQRRTLYCPRGKKAIGGGAEARGPLAVLVGSFPTDDDSGWIALGRQTDGNSVGISVFVICAKV